MPETLTAQKLVYILALICEEEWFKYLFSVLRNMSYKLETIGHFFIQHFCPQKLRMKKCLTSVLG